MPARRQTAKKEVQFDKNLFLIIGAAVVLGIGLYFLISNFYPISIPGFGTLSNDLSLACSKEDDQIKCNWRNCELGDRNELVFAKVPDYVKSVEIPMESGSLLFSPNADPLKGLYTIYISCDNGKVATRVSM